MYMGTEQSKAVDGMKTNCIVGVGALSFMFFVWALREMGPGNEGLAQVTATGGMMLWAVMAWRIFKA